jgi:hypothetical protein
MSNQKCDIRDCPNSRRTKKYGKNLCKYHYRTIDQLKGKLSLTKSVEGLLWTNCEWCNHRVPRTITHHFSYQPEKTIELCDRCHQDVHDENNHILEPSEYQKWQADLPLRQVDVKKLKACGRFEIKDPAKPKEKNEAQLKEVYDEGSSFVIDFESKGEVHYDKSLLNRSDFSFPGQAPWNIEEVKK